MRVPIDDLDFRDGCLRGGKLFTGTSIETWPDGSPRAEQDFHHGYKHGWYREWSQGGTLITERPQLSGLVHGLARTWYPGGQLASETHYQFGIRLSEARWNQEGQREADFRLDKASTAYADLQRELAQEAKRAR